ncbi:Na/Pi cotransporter family protein [candidate division TA06 bacterium]|uniref:Na/Pi cotransporter family protein n=1 Tax=candidate division TA06 bacterium TaxID=2250710 RepID=A0A523UVD2_UNCT6|nr:MAG: Na/Pi cotransporter family protein [candidate division TA06 bacterium]
MARELIFGLIGGLGLFLFGMKIMSEALRKVAGERLRRILQLLTRTPFIGVLVGAAITALIQSSSGTTVMTVGFVNAGLLTLRQAISVVMGANIGTTTTAWLVSFLAIFKISTYALPAIGVGFLLSLLGRTRNAKSWGQVILGFGLLFLGLGVMKEAFAPLGASEAVKHVMMKFAQYPILGVLVGCVVTMLLQSSSATIATIQVLAFNGLISFESAIPLILGDNIGTTITAEIASLGTNLTARRTARAHTMFNVIGVAYMLIFVYTNLYPRMIHAIVPGAITKNNIMVHIALAHSVFNIFNTFIVFLPGISILERVAIKLTPGKERGLVLAPNLLEKHLLDTPPLAIDQVMKETVRMSETARDAIDRAAQAFFSGNMRLKSDVTANEEALDRFQHDITQYLVELSQKNLGRVESEKLPVLLHSVNDLERVGDHAENLMELAERKKEQRLHISPSAIAELKRMVARVDEMMVFVGSALSNYDSEDAKRALKCEDDLNRMQIEFRASHIERLNKGICLPLSGILFLDFVDNVEKVGDHLTNIAQSVLYGFRWDGVQPQLG